MINRGILRSIVRSVVAPETDRTINRGTLRPIVRSIVASCDRSYDQSWHPTTARTINRNILRPIVRSIVAPTIYRTINRATADPRSSATGSATTNRRLEVLNMTIDLAATDLPYDQSCDCRSAIIRNWRCDQARLLVRSRRT